MIGHDAHICHDKRLTAYRQQVWLENSAGSLRVFCGCVGLLGLLVLGLLEFSRAFNILKGVHPGGTLGMLTHLGKAVFCGCSLWGLLEPWTAYCEENAKQCHRRKETLGQMEQDPDWWRKRDEEQRQRQKEREELESKFADLDIRPDPDYWKKALQRSQDSLAILTRQIRDTKDKGMKR